ncbi:hypothetical protein [Shewanella sp. AC91-MNA-CIBAN-0169]
MKGNYLESKKQEFYGGSGGILLKWQGVADNGNTLLIDYGE